MPSTIMIFVCWQNWLPHINLEKQLKLLCCPNKKICIAKWIDDTATDIHQGRLVILAYPFLVAPPRSSKWSNTVDLGRFRLPIRPPWNVNNKQKHKNEVNKLNNHSGMTRREPIRFLKIVKVPLHLPSKTCCAVKAGRTFWKRKENILEIIEVRIFKDLTTGLEQNYSI